MGALDEFRIGCVQPDEQTAEMKILYDLSEAAHIAMLKAMKGQPPDGTQ